MSDDGYYGEDELLERLKRRRKGQPSERPNFLDDIFDPSIQQSMSKPLFKLIRTWVGSQVGVDVIYLVWSIAIFASARKYGAAAIDWLSKSLTNSVELDPSGAFAIDLLIWIQKQPSHQYLAWIPTFELLEWADLNKMSEKEPWRNVTEELKTKENEEGKSHELLSSEGYTPFFFQGIPFLLHRPNSKKHTQKVTLRCLWGSSKPLDALLKEVCRTAESDHKHLNVTYVSLGDDKTQKCRKRLLETVGLDPQVKQELLSDLQEFLDEDTEDYYYQNGTPYRRGYLFHGPPGTGKTSLSTAIANTYDLPLYVINIAGMDDNKLQEKVQSLPKRCVILFEDIDAAGINCERAMTLKDRPKIAKQGHHASSDSEENNVEPPIRSKIHTSSIRPANIASGPVPPRKTQVTLSGLLNTMDGSGSKEGHILILTTNAPDSLDSAIYRPGRIDLKLYMGYSNKITASITFNRIFGSDKRLVLSKRELFRLSKRFGKMIPMNFLTPADIQRFCMVRRGQPQKAVAEFPKFILEKRAGKPEFEYDINRAAPVPVFNDATGEEGDSSSDHEDDMHASIDPSAEADILDPNDNEEELHVLGHSDLETEDGLAYGKYNLKNEDDDAIKRVGRSLRQLSLGLFPSLTPALFGSGRDVERMPRDDLSVPSIRMSTMNMRPQPLRSGWNHQAFPQNSHAEDVNVQTESDLPVKSPGRWVPMARSDGLAASTAFHSQTENELELPPSIHIRNTSQYTLPARPPSPSDATDTSVYYSPLSTGEQLEATFLRYRGSSHPEVVGRQNMHPYHGPLPAIAEGNPWDEGCQGRVGTVLLRAMQPQPLEDLGYTLLDIEDADHW